MALIFRKHEGATFKVHAYPGRDQKILRKPREISPPPLSPPLPPSLPPCREENTICHRACASSEVRRDCTRDEMNPPPLPARTSYFVSCAANRHLCALPMIDRDRVGKQVTYVTCRCRYFLFHVIYFGKRTIMLTKLRNFYTCRA